VAKNGETLYLHGILCTFCKTAGGRPSKWETIKMELGIGAGGWDGMGIGWKWLKNVSRGGLWCWGC
jgi:hypothetical protein